MGINGKTDIYPFSLIALVSWWYQYENRVFADFDKIVPFPARRARWRRRTVVANCDGYTLQLK